MSCLSLKELQLSVNILPSTTLKLQLLYSQSAVKWSVNEFLEMVSSLPFGICKRSDIFLAFTQKQIPGASTCWLTLYVSFVILRVTVKLLDLFLMLFGQVVWHFNLCNFDNYTNTDVSAPECLYS